MTYEAVQVIYPEADAQMLQLKGGQAAVPSYWIRFE